MNKKRATLDKVVSLMTFKGSLLCLSFILFLAHPFNVAPDNLLQGVEHNRHYNFRILAQTSPSNEKTQLGSAKTQSAGVCTTHMKDIKEGSAQVSQIEPRCIPQQAHSGENVWPKGPKSHCHGIPKNRLGKYKVSNSNLSSQMNKKNKKIKELQESNYHNSDKHIPEQNIKLTEEEVLIKLNNLNKSVCRKDMYLLWFNFHNIYVRKYYAMMNEVWMNAVSFASRYNIPEENFQKIWWRVYEKLITVLRDNDKSCINDFYNLFDKGECTSDEYKSFLERRKKIWTDSINMMRFKW
ncbi:Plasmodium exported protein, unknown function [Plasmodium knowlesi strain H]|uniref:Plasmodium RESA N-terminal domain-containing protein n=3 Tax=Plasmodium knowlesi TaxID=5850 RepID=A0A5K1UEY8_PLAKH|nr:Plasmodium exported protein (PHISTc), unknown function [Plasmodium knowlesi strain H]OTN66582.1 Uncharacterized protein PKNOH_S08507700 [Plasmodium knowlesi]CAA9986654.1 Plasmodium exported protein (PHISTc), unknown function [Plasmodium knowlesi strain H]SBO23458.1 Plasmodium exported protein, unknown function [Plasmodium knowlesi strain H]SBO24888.1 Plasmodium exported protein, unknown function [Plasmodium knowlesi strain H]VVS76128.1 Plasmodium exported protein (PHISTc), unknown function |eukprot:XP_002257840.1 hypothetical protein, conserved in Plasmodium species [Plasmodium knowlesi strain H]